MSAQSHTQWRMWRCSTCGLVAKIDKRTDKCENCGAVQE